MTVLEPALGPGIALSVLVFALGAVIGSFLNVVIHRVPRHLSIVRPPSSCPKCEHRIPAYWNLPILSWLLLRGRCRWCHTRIPARYPLVELLSALLALACLWRFGFTLQAASVFALLAALLAVAWIDWEHMIIPDAISLGFLALGLALSPFIGPGLLRSLGGAVVGGGLLLLLGVLWQKTRGVEGMGGGDIKLMAAVGAFLGPVLSLLVIFVGAFLGALYGVVLLRKGGQAKVAFGTFLSMAAALVIFFGPWLIDWYLGAIRLGS